MLVAIFSLLLIFNVIYAHIVNSLRRKRRRTIIIPNQGHAHDPSHHHHDGNHDFLLDKQGRARPMVVEHHIWYINTVGLQPSVINSISVCKYKRGDGVIDGTDCAVFLSEFEEDESLRLLPKCNHAFHLPCIDTWLRSHTNCPMFRAPVPSSLTRLIIPTREEDTSSPSPGSGELMNRKPLRRTFSMDSAMSSSSVVSSPYHSEESVEIGGARGC
ncbi:hypothetical protein Dimus_026269 [Dionaea muscipula]